MERRHGWIVHSMTDSIDLPLWHGWHITIFGPAFWLLLVAIGVVAIARIGSGWLSRR